MTAVRRAFREDILCKRAADRLAPEGLPIHRDEPFFDPGLRLPCCEPQDCRYPTLGQLLTVLPDPYARRVEVAFTQMSDFASAFWPLIDGLVLAQPLLEWFMHADLVNPYYRDHIVHQVRVASIGDLLLDTELDGQTLLRRATSILRTDLPIELGHPEDFVRLAWWFAALFHDCGYPYQYFTELCRWLRSFHKAPIPDPASTAWTRVLAHLAELVGGLSSADFHNLSDGKHAFYSAVEIAAQSLAYESGLGATEDKECRTRRRALLRLAVRAILRHHSNTERVEFDSNPLGFLLILADELHEAERPQGTTRAQNKDTITTYSPNPVKAASLAIKQVNQQYHLHLRFDTPPDAIVAGKPAKRWCEKKQEDLRKYLALGRRSLFSQLTVTIRNP